jgi:hypothetical protein
MAETVTWIDAGGTSWVLDGSSYYRAVDGRMGAFAPPTAIIEQEVPLLAGARFRQVKISSRPVRIPVLVKAADESTLAVARRAFRYALNPKRGAGTLQITAEDGTVRQLTCYCESGFEGDESIGVRGPGWFKVGLSFRALDPFWYDASFTSTTYTTFGSKTITNGGDQDCYPIWTITGPGNTISITNNTSGKLLALSGNGGLTLTAGQVLTIDTRRDQLTIVREDGSNQFSYLSAASALFQLVPGSNAIVLAMAGTTGASSIQVQYKRAWDGF